MTTDSTATAGRDARQDDFGPTLFRHRPQPGSPTLTNPDMILPAFNESEPLGNLSHLSSATWNDHQLPDAFRDNFSSTEYMSSPLSPNTPIIYGNGTMLSDIGEVTEVESTVGYEPSRNSSRPSGKRPGTGGGDTPLRSSPIMGKNTLKNRPQIMNRERRLSIESTTTIQSTEAPDGTFGDFDDSVSVDDSSFQGDDEESIASESVDEQSAQLINSATVTPPNQVLNDGILSANSISKRAEQILANAKRRLTAMEGNLNNARTFSYSPVSDGSTPSPGGARSIGLPKGRMQSITPSHSRNVSDNGLHDFMRTSMLPQRSASALGAAGGYRQQLPLSRSADALGAKSSLGSLRSPLCSIDSTLEPLDENEDAEGDVQSRSINRLRSRERSALRSYADAGVARSASAAQMRDLQEQMQGLKGKISSLREQAKRDSMKRRSLQNLRALSPFTNAAQDPGFTSPKSSASAGSGSPAPSHTLDSTTTSTPENERCGIQRGQEQEPYIDNEERAGLFSGRFHEARGSQLPGLGGDSHFPNGASQEEQRQPDDEEICVKETLSALHGDDKEEDEDASEDHVSESGESLYHDTHQDPGDISHEDREDAFDYEHFYLHSAMGTLSRQGMARTGSFSSEGSEDSTETTRGPATTHARRPSVDTTASIDSFATAREDRAESRSSTAQSSRLDDDCVTPLPQYSDDDSATATRRSTFGGFGHQSRSGGGSGSNSGSGGGSGSGSDPRPYFDKHARHSSVIPRTLSSSTDTTLHRPSVSSFESIGTNRSFPLVNKIRLSGGGFTPGGSPDHKLRRVAEPRVNETASNHDKDSAGSGHNSPAIQTLSREDQVLVEQVVASLGRCVLGLSESARQGTGNDDHYRRSIEAAKKLLEKASD